MGWYLSYVVWYYVDRQRHWQSFYGNQDPATALQVPDHQRCQHKCVPTCNPRPHTIIQYTLIILDQTLLWTFYLYFSKPKKKKKPQVVNTCVIESEKERDESFVKFVMENWGFDSNFSTCFHLLFGIIGAAWLGLAWLSLIIGVEIAQFRWLNKLKKI